MPLEGGKGHTHTYCTYHTQMFLFEQSCHVRCSSVLPTFLSTSSAASLILLSSLPSRSRLLETNSPSLCSVSCSWSPNSLLGYTTGEKMAVQYHTTYTDSRGNSLIHYLNYNLPFSLHRYIYHPPPSFPFLPPSPPFTSLCMHVRPYLSSTQSFSACCMIWSNSFKALCPSWWCFSNLVWMAALDRHSYSTTTQQHNTTRKHNITEDNKKTQLNRRQQENTT